MGHPETPLSKNIPQSAKKNTIFGQPRAQGFSLFIGQPEFSPRVALIPVTVFISIYLSVKG
jgi:hypothetical protein